MTAISILPIIDETGQHHYRASSGDRQSIGKTPGEALDAIVAQFGQPSLPFLLLIPNFQPDPFFTAQQQQRLTQLMTAWKQARDAAEDFPEDLKAELNKLVEAELLASRDRLSAMTPIS
jgi:hypothetical protein